MKNRKILIGITAGLIVFGMFCAGMLLRQWHDATKSRETFEELSKLVEDSDREPGQDSKESSGQSDKEENSDSGDEEHPVPETGGILEKYRALYEENNDMVGWIRIEGTKVDYPVMQTKESPEFYLDHGFDKSESIYGVPCLDAACDVNSSNNLIIYGHRMKNGTMFGNLKYYVDKSFYEENRIIQFDTLTSSGKYEIVAVFPFDCEHDEFRYNAFTEMDEEAFTELMKNVHARQYYDTGVEAKYGDQLITLSTCEYTYSDGRLVVVAKKI